jgi:hypothetical protein
MGRGALTAAACFVLTASTLAAPRPKDAPDTEKVWDLNTYLKGTAAEIRGTLQKSVDEFTQKTAEAERQVQVCKSDYEKRRAVVVQQARDSDSYRELAAVLAEAEKSLAEVRRSGTSLERVAVSGRANRARQGMKAIEMAAPPNDEQLRVTKRLWVEADESVARCRESLKKARAWRDKLITTIIRTYRLDGPLRFGREGTIVEAKVLAANRDSLLVECFVPESFVNEGEKEGIVHLSAVGKEVKIQVLAGGPSYKVGDVVDLPHNFVVTDLRFDGELTPIYTAKPKRAELDDLLDRVSPLLGT